MASGEEGGDKAEKDDQFWTGGIGGLKVLIAAKIRDGLRAFIEHVVTISSTACGLTSAFTLTSPFPHRF